MDVCIMRNYGNPIPRRNLRFEHAVFLLNTHKDDLFLTVMDKYLRHSGHVTVLLSCKFGSNGTFYQNNLHAQYFSTKLRESIQIIPNPRAYIERNYTAMYRPSIVVTDDSDSEVYLQKYCPQYYNYASNHFCQLNISGCIEGLNLAHPIDLSKFDHQLSLFSCNYLRHKVCVQSIIQILPPCFIFFTAFGDYKEKLRFQEVINSFILFKYQYDKYFGHEIMLVLGGEFFPPGSAESKYRDYLRSSLESLKKDHNVIFLKKALNHAEKKTLLRLSYAALYLDNNPNFEDIKFAMSLGTPIISSNVGFGANMVDHGITGFTVEPERIDVIASCMETLSIPTVYHRFSMAARKAYLKSYSETSMFLQTVSVTEIPDIKTSQMSTNTGVVYDSVVNADFIQSVNNFNIENDWYVKNQYSSNNKHNSVFEKDANQTEYEKHIEQKIAIQKQFYVNSNTELYPEFRFEYISLPRWSEEDEVCDQMYGDHLFEMEPVRQIEIKDQALSEQPENPMKINPNQENWDAGYQLNQMIQTYQPSSVDPYQSTSQEQYEPLSVDTYNPSLIETYQPSSAEVYKCLPFDRYQPSSVETYKPSPVQLYQSSPSELYQALSTGTYKPPLVETYQPPSAELYQTPYTEASQHLPAGTYQYPLNETYQLPSVKPLNFLPQQTMQSLESMQLQLNQPMQKSYQLPPNEPYLSARDLPIEPQVAQPYPKETIQSLEPTQLQFNQASFKPYQFPAVEPYASLRRHPVESQMTHPYSKETVQSLESILSHQTHAMQQHQPVQQVQSQSLEQLLNQPIQQLQNQPMQQVQNQSMQQILNLQQLQNRPMQQLQNQSMQQLQNQPMQQLQIQPMPQLQNLTMQQLQKLTMQQLQNLSIQQLQNPTIPALDSVQQHSNGAMQQRDVLLLQQKEAMQLQQNEALQLQLQQKEAMQSYQQMQMQPNQTLQPYQTMQPNLNKTIVPSYQSIQQKNQSLQSFQSGQHFPIQPPQVLPSQQPVRPYYVGVMKQYPRQVIQAVPMQNYPRSQLVIPNQPFWFRVASAPPQLSEPQFSGSEYTTPRQYFEPEEEEVAENEDPDANNPARRWEEVFANDSMDEYSAHGSELSETREDAWSGICSDDTPSTSNKSWRVFNHSYHSNSQYSDDAWEETNQDSGDEVRREENGLQYYDREINGSLTAGKVTEEVDKPNGCKECREEECVKELHAKVDAKLENNQDIDTTFQKRSKSARRKAKKRRMKKERSELFD